MTAKKSSMRTVVSGSDKGVWVGAVRGFDGGLAGEEVSDVAEGRRGREGAESVDGREGFWACAGSG